MTDTPSTPPDDGAPPPGVDGDSKLSLLEMAQRLEAEADKQQQQQERFVANGFQATPDDGVMKTVTSMRRAAVMFDLCRTGRMSVRRGAAPLGPNRGDKK